MTVQIVDVQLLDELGVGRPLATLVHLVVHGPKRIQSHALHLDGRPVVFALGLLGDKAHQMELQVCQMVQWRFLAVQYRVKKHARYEVIFIEEGLVTDLGGVVVRQSIKARVIDGHALEADNFIFFIFHLDCCHLTLHWEQYGQEKSQGAEILELGCFE